MSAIHGALRLGNHCRTEGSSDLVSGSPVPALVAVSHRPGRPRLCGTVIRADGMLGKAHAVG
ncbi:MAG: hypothetical protein PHY05_11065 [Methanothrix sp.]|nr:hypothetical protein [Methanothrix sp.]